MSKIRQIEEKEIHVLKADGKFTACGFDTTKNPENWEHVSTSSKVTCSKNGCKQAQ
ncbi:hypothetical protein [Clostridium sp. UBA1652]|uniref:hypothetical protein n=1 Tax=Clostridium sp. UBA1652 TaxID=1946348 RepID=UPI00257C760D|nr:hypothetical protein [Clostridium sp. UBA1652]